MIRPGGFPRRVCPGPRDANTTEAMESEYLIRLVHERIAISMVSVGPAWKFNEGVRSTAVTGIILEIFGGCFLFRLVEYTECITWS